MSSIHHGSYIFQLVNKSSLLAMSDHFISLHVETFSNSCLGNLNIHFFFTHNKGVR